MASGDLSESEMADPIQMILFGNEAVQATFKDGCKIQMSACGTAFVHDQPNGRESHRLHSVSRTTHRTEFTTSKYQLKVMKILAFKNRYSSRPYLCSSLPASNQATTMYEDIVHAKWPLSVIDHRCAVLASNGTYSITSLDGHASLTLAAHGKSFIVRYLAKISAGASPGTRASSGRELDEGTDSETQSTCSSTNSCVKWRYTRVSLHHPVDDCPSCWQYPLQLLLSYRQLEESKNNNSNNNNNSNSESTTAVNRTPVEDILETKLKKFNLSLSIGGDVSTIQEKSGEKSVSTNLPPSLGLTCPGRHLHKWRQLAAGTAADDLNDCYMYNKIKVVYVPNAVYRVVYAHHRHIQIYPTDGSILISRGTESGYFDHYIPTDDGVSDRTYSIKVPPPDTGRLRYSVNQLLQTASTILKCVSTMVGTPDDEICWMAAPSITPPANARNLIIEDQTIEGVANFQATTNGRVRILFADRTRIDFKFDYDAAKHLRRERGLDFQVVDILPPYCRLMNSVAEYEQISLHQDSPYTSYVEAVKDWVAWVLAPAEDRTERFVINARQLERQASVQQELKKIECFNYILDNVVLNTVEDVHEDGADKSKEGVKSPKRTSRHATDQKRNGSREGHVIGEEALSPAVVADILRRNKMAIREIEEFTSGSEL